MAYTASLIDKGQSQPEAHANLELPSSLQAFIEGGDSALEAAKQAINYAQKKGGNLIIDREGSNYGPPPQSGCEDLLCWRELCRPYCGDDSCKRRARNFWNTGGDKPGSDRRKSRKAS